MYSKDQDHMMSLTLTVFSSFAMMLKDVEASGDAWHTNMGMNMSRIICNKLRSV